MARILGIAACVAWVGIGGLFVAAGLRGGHGLLAAAGGLLVAATVGMLRELWS